MAFCASRIGTVTRSGEVLELNVELLFTLCPLIEQDRRLNSAGLSSYINDSAEVKDMEGLFNSMNNLGNSFSSNFKAATAGTDGGYESDSAENAGRMTDATGAADSKVTNAGIKKIETDAKNTVEAMSQDSDLKHLSNVASTAKGINY